MSPSSPARLGSFDDLAYASPVETSAGKGVRRYLRSAARQFIELVPPRVGLPLRAWKNFPRVHGLHAPARALCRLVPTGRAAVDAGANRGVYAYWIAQRATHVYAFEPSPGPSGYLRRARVPNITVFDVALSNTPGEGVLHVPAVDGEASLGDHVDREGATPVPVKLACLDDFALADVGFVKIDVEGHELQVLQGGADTIRRCRPVLFVEIEQRYQRGEITDIFDYIAGDLSYAYGYSWHQGRLVPLADFRLARDQTATTGDWTGRYINNFVFADMPIK